MSVLHSNIYFYIVGILSVITVIGQWKIFTNYGEEGWKALIPCYRWVPFGKIAGRKKEGEMIAYTSLLVLLSAFGLFLSFLLSMDYSVVESVMTADGTMVDKILPVLPNISIGFWMLFFAVVFHVSLIASIVLSLMIEYDFTLKEDGATWWILLWLLIPAIPSIYFGFFNDNNVARY